MNISTRRRRLPFLLSALLTFVATSMAAPSGAHAQDGVVLKPSYKAGNTYKFSQAQSMQMEANGATQNVTTDMGMTAIATKRTDGEAGVRVKTTIDSIKFATENPALGGKMSYDSTNPVDENSALAVQFKPILNQPMTIIFDADGKVVDFEGFEEFMAAAGAGAQMFTKEQFAQMADPTAMLGLGTEPKAVGATWSAEPTVDLAQMGTIRMPMELTYTKNETVDGKECARIETIGTAEMKMNIPGAEGTAGGVTSTDSKVTGHYLIDPELGMLRDSVVHMDLTLAIDGGGQQMTIPIKQVVNYKLVSVEKNGG